MRFLLISETKSKFYDGRIVFNTDVISIERGGPAVGAKEKSYTPGKAFTEVKISRIRSYA